MKHSSSQMQILKESFVILSMILAAFNAMANEQKNEDRIWFFHQSWCPTNIELDRLSKLVSLTMKGCCILYARPLSRDAFQESSLDPWRGKLQTAPGVEMCTGSQENQAAEDLERIRPMLEQERSAKIKLEDAQATEKIASIKNLDREKFCAFYGESIRDNRQDVLRAFRAEAAKRKIKLVEKAAASESVSLGIGVCQLYAAWGLPISANRSVGSWGIDVQHVYGNGTYVYTRNGIVTSWQD